MDCIFFIAIAPGGNHITGECRLSVLVNKPSDECRPVALLNKHGHPLLQL